MHPKSSKLLIRKKIELTKRASLTSKRVIHLDEMRTLKSRRKERSVLVVDDDANIRNAMKRVLESEGFNVITAEDGLGLSESLDRYNLDIIFLDINLPWVDGYELCSILKKSALSNKIPIVCVSTPKSEDDIKKAFDAGCDYFLNKPLNLEQVISSICKLTEPQLDVEL